MGNEDVLEIIYPDNWKIFKSKQIKDVGEDVCDWICKMGIINREVMEIFKDKLNMNVSSYFCSPNLNYDIVLNVTIFQACLTLFDDMVVEKTEKNFHEYEKVIKIVNGEDVQIEEGEIFENAFKDIMTRLHVSKISSNILKRLGNDFGQWLYYAHREKKVNKIDEENMVFEDFSILRSLAAGYLVFFTLSESVFCIDGDEVGKNLQVRKLLFHLSTIAALQNDIFSIEKDAEGGMINLVSAFQKLRSSSTKNSAGAMIKYHSEIIEKCEKIFENLNEELKTEISPWIQFIKNAVATIGYRISVEERHKTTINVNRTNTVSCVVKNNFEIM